VSFATEIDPHGGAGAVGGHRGFADLVEERIESRVRLTEHVNRAIRKIEPDLVVCRREGDDPLALSFMAMICSGVTVTATVAPSQFAGVAISQMRYCRAYEPTGVPAATLTMPVATFSSMLVPVCRSSVLLLLLLTAPLQASTDDAALTGAPIERFHRVDERL
jgi:hypothetical protein